MRRATVLVLKERAEILEHGEGALHSERLVLERPCVIRLVRYVRVPRDVHRRKITRKAVLARDAYTCQYCGRESHGLTVDHVIPRSRGGISAWDNIVAACAPCNRRKGNRLPREATMPLRAHPKPPGPTVFIRIASPRVPSAWEQYLLAAEPGDAQRRAAPEAAPRDCVRLRRAGIGSGWDNLPPLGPPVPGLDFTRRPHLPS